MGPRLQLFASLPLSFNYERWWKNICHCLSLPLFFHSFPPISVFLRRGGRISGDEGDHSHRPNQHHLSLPFSQSFGLLPQAAASRLLSSGCSALSFPLIAAAAAAMKTSCFNRAAALRHASPGTPQRPRGIPQGAVFSFFFSFLSRREDLRE